MSEHLQHYNVNLSNSSNVEFNRTVIGTNSFAIGIEGGHITYRLPVANKQIDQQIAGALNSLRGSLDDSINETPTHVIRNVYIYNGNASKDVKEAITRIMDIVQTKGIIQPKTAALINPNLAPATDWIYLNNHYIESIGTARIPYHKLSTLPGINLSIKLKPLTIPTTTPDEIRTALKSTGLNFTYQSSDNTFSAPIPINKPMTEIMKSVTSALLNDQKLDRGSAETIYNEYGIPKIGRFQG